MSDSTGGMGAEVGVRKIDGDGNVDQEEGAIDSGISTTTWVILTLMLTLDAIGLWKVLELIQIL